MLWAACSKTYTCTLCTLFVHTLIPTLNTQKKELIIINPHHYKHAYYNSVCCSSVAGCDIVTDDGVDISEAVGCVMAIVATLAALLTYVLYAIAFPQTTNSGIQTLM